LQGRGRHNWKNVSERKKERSLFEMTRQGETKLVDDQIPHIQAAPRGEEKKKGGTGFATKQCDPEKNVEPE